MAAYRVTRERVERAERALGPGPWAGADLRRLGWSARQLEAAVRTGALSRVRRGVYRAAPLASGAHGGHDAVSLGQIRATLAGLSGRAVASHDSAATCHQLWCPGKPSSVVHATIPGQPERQAVGLRVHASRLPEEFVTDVDGIRVTTIARSAIDLARGRSFSDALVAVDGAWRRLVHDQRPLAKDELRARTVPEVVLSGTRDELEAAFAVTWSWPGTRVVRAALDLADPVSESPFESWSRGWIVRAGLPAFEVNGEVVGASGRVYFGDFVWRSSRLIGEADGVGKYGETPLEIRAAMRAERERQADLEAAGWTFVRWMSGSSGRNIAARLGNALDLPRVTPRTDRFEVRTGRFAV